MVGGEENMKRSWLICSELENEEIEEWKEFKVVVVKEEKEEINGKMRVELDGEEWIWRRIEWGKGILKESIVMVMKKEMWDWKIFKKWDGWFIGGGNIKRNRWWIRIIKENWEEGLRRIRKKENVWKNRKERRKEDKMRNWKKDDVRRKRVKKRRIR